MKLNPFQGLPNKREVWAWGMFDLANQSFTLLITTVFFGIYFTNTIADDPARGQLLWGRAFSIAALIVVVISPFLGAIADFTRLKKEFLIASAIGCSLLTCALALTQPGAVVPAMAIYIAANVCFMTGENFLGSLLPDVSTRETMGRISGIGWTMGYIGALLCLPIALVLPGVAQQTPSGFKLVFLFAGGWFILNAIPTVLFVKERVPKAPLPKGTNLVTIGFVRVVQSAREAGRFRDLAFFLTCFLVYSCAMQTIIAFAGIIAKEFLGEGMVVAGKEISGGILLVVFVWLLALVSGIGSFTTLFVQDRIGHKLTLGLALGVWIATTLGAAALPAEGKPSMLHLGLVGAGVGIGLGVVGPASRAIVGLLTPEAKTAEFFGLWGLAYKLGAVLGPAAYGMVVAGVSRSAAMLMLASFFLVGLVGICFVDLSRGMRAADTYEPRGPSSSD